VSDPIPPQSPPPHNPVPPVPPPPGRRRVNSGPGRVLVAVYILFAIAATSRAALQIATKFDEAPVAYLLSALAAVIYIVATVGLARGDRIGRRTAIVCCTVELVGVLTVGALSLLDPALFPDDTVWSDFGGGYGYIPLVLPVLGLLWLRRTRSAATA
jgi:cytochrome bd-type quinol oxidase subunit 2